MSSIIYIPSQILALRKEDHNQTKEVTTAESLTKGKCKLNASGC